MGVLVQARVVFSRRRGWSPTGFPIWDAWLFWVWPCSFLIYTLANTILKMIVNDGYHRLLVKSHGNSVLYCCNLCCISDKTNLVWFYIWFRYGKATDSHIFGKTCKMCLIWWRKQQRWNNNAAAPTYESTSQARVTWCIKQLFADLKVQHEVDVYIYYMYAHINISVYK